MGWASHQKAFGGQGTQVGEPLPRIGARELLGGGVGMPSKWEMWGE